MIILWRVTEACNFSCPFCAYDRRLDFPRRSADPARIEKLIDLLGRWQSLHGKRPLLSWLGGEPFLWKPLEALTRTAVGCRIAISATTNGSTLHLARVREHILANYAELTVSIDGSADFHDRMRGRPGVFDGVKQGVRALVRARQSTSTPRLRANVVLMHNNVEAFPDLCLRLADWGLDEISFNQLGGRDRPDFHATHRLTPSDATFLATAVPRLRTRLAGRVRVLGGPAYIQRIGESASGVSLPISDCRVAEQFLFIDEDGWIAPCSFQPRPFGINVSDLTTAADLDDLAQRLTNRQRTDPIRECGDCPSTQQFAKFLG